MFIIISYVDDTNSRKGSVIVALKVQFTMDCSTRFKNGLVIDSYEEIY